MLKFKLWLEAGTELPFASVTEDGITFTTGRPVTFHFIRKKTPALHFGTRFQQDIEPAGRYMIHNENPGQLTSGGWEEGDITFRKPLVILFSSAQYDTDEFGQYDQRSWKHALYVHYSKRGKRLSRAIRADGYDGIVTVTHFDTREIVDLSMF